MLTGARHLAPEPARYFEMLRRVVYRRIEEPLSPEEAAALIDAERQVMCVLNTRKDAVAVVRACRRGNDLLHLSTLLCPDHRKRILDEVRQRLDAGEPVRLVATQVVEAGVDVDFPKVMRVTGPLDRIVQAAGRCNREGKLPAPGECIVFDLDGGAAPQGWYKTGIELAATMVREDVATIDRPDRVAEYFRDLYRYTSTDQCGVQDLRKALAFEKVAEAFRMIPDETVALAVPGCARERVDELLRQPAEARNAEWYRRIAQYSVGVPRWQLRKLQEQNLAMQEPGGYWVYTGVYDRLVGIGRGDESDSADLVTRTNSERREEPHAR
jgi:CRISPR-associated endonuclease/helicase Cas3